MNCKCGGQLEVSLVDGVAILKCTACGRGELILQSKPQDVFEYRARVTQATEGSPDHEVSERLAK